MKIITEQQGCASYDSSFMDCMVNRSAGGSAMKDSLLSANAAGNGFSMRINNVDASASIALSSGGGNFDSSGTTLYTVYPNNLVEFASDGVNWRTRIVQSLSGAQSIAGATGVAGLTAGGSIVTIGVCPSNTDAQNSALIVAAITSLNSVGGGTLLIDIPGVSQVANTIVLYSNIKLRLGAGTTLQLSAGSARNLIVNNAYLNPVFKAITSLSSSGAVITVNCVGHGFTVGQWIFIEGVGGAGYNGTIQVATVVDADHFTYQTSFTPTNISPSVYTGPKASGSWAMQACPADTNISIEGGILDWNGANQTFPNDTSTYGVILHRIYNPQIIGTQGLNANKYMFCIAGSSGFRGRNISLATLSDGVNLMAPCFNAVVDGVSGSTGDDFVSILSGDTTAKTFSVGDHVNVTVNNINSQGPSSLAAIKLAGNAPFVFEQVNGLNITGVGSTSAAVSIVNDTNMVGGIIGTCSFKNVDRVLNSGNTGELLNYTMTGAGGSLAISGVYNGYGAQGVRIASGTSLTELITDIRCAVAATSLPVVSITGTVDDVRLTHKSTATFAGTVCQINSGATVDVIQCFGDWRGTTAAKGVYHLNGTLNRVITGPLSLTNVRSVYESETTAANSAILEMNQVTLNGCIGLLLLRKSCTVHVGNVNAASLTQQLITDTNNSITVTAYLNGNIVSNTALFAANATNTRIVRGNRYNQSPAFSATPTWIYSLGGVVTPAALTAAVTAITQTDIPPAGERITVVLTQDATGGRAITAPATWKFPTAAFVNGSAATGGQKTVLDFVSDGTNLIAQGTNAWN